MKKGFTYYIGDTKTFTVRIKAGGRPTSIVGETLLVIISTERASSVISREAVTEHTDAENGISQFTIDPTLGLTAGQYWITIILRDGTADLTFAIITLDALERVPADE